MAQKTFTNEQLCKVWYEVANTTPVGTRQDVVAGVMAVAGIENTKQNAARMYNNVTQRVKQLESGTPPAVFPKLAVGKKGARRSAADVASLQAILTPATVPVE